MLKPIGYIDSLTDKENRITIKITINEDIFSIESPLNNRELFSYLLRLLVVLNERREKEEDYRGNSKES